MKQKMVKKQKEKLVAENRRGYFDYKILETYEAGLALFGYEVKAAKTGHLSLKGSYVVIKGGELYLINAFIPPYQKKNTPEDYNPERTRKLLLKKSEIKSLIGKSKQKGLTLIPLKVYTKRNLLKLEFGLSRGKKEIDKREAIKEREFKRKKDILLKNV